MFTAAGGGAAPVKSRRFATKYSSIVPWKSRWSWVRFVKTSASKRTRSSRCSTEACEDASSATLRSPASSISRNVRCRSIASGVVRTTGRTSPPIRLSTVPSRPGRRPAAVRIACSRYAVVVLPFVPVTPATSSSRVGSPKKTSAAVAIAARDDGTTSCGTSGSTARSTTRTAAPCSTASAAKSCPSACSPGTQKNAAPGVTARVSYARSRTSTGSGLPRTASGASAATRRSSSMSGGTLPSGGGVRCRVRRDLELDEAVARDLGEGGRRDDAAPDRSVRLVDRDEHDEPRVLRRHDADERGDVARVGVPARARASRRCRSCPRRCSPARRRARRCRPRPRRRRAASPSSAPRRSWR